MGKTLTDVPAKQGDSQHTGATAKTDYRLARTWLGRLATYIASAARGMAVNDISGTLTRMPAPRQSRKTLSAACECISSSERIDFILR